MDQMRSCVVTLLDLVNMKKLLADDGKRPLAIQAMEALDRICNRRSQDLRNIDHIYCWNDSVLLLSYLDQFPRDMSALVQEISEIKCAIDGECKMKSFVAMVKGMTFVPNDLQIRAPMQRGSEPNPVYHYMLASSMAFANCYTIIKLFRNDHHDWYIDERVQQVLNSVLQGRLTERNKFSALPEMTTRRVFTADGYLHPSGE